MVRKTVLGLFKNTSDVDQALHDLADAGYTEADVSIITSEKRDEMTEEVKNAKSEGAVGKGAATGGIIGGLTGLLVGIGALAIPGIGPLLLTGPLAAAFGITGATATTVGGAITGAVAGGLIGALEKIGVNQTQAKLIEDRIKEGDTLLMVVPSEGDSGEVKDILKDDGGEHISEENLNI